MATAESVKAKIQGLINTANSTTGGTDTDLTAAVNALIAGFGQSGGGDSGASGIYMAKVTPAENVNTIDVVHNLGTADILFAACFAETLGGIIPTKNSTMGRFFAKTDIPFRFGSTSGENYQVHSNYLTASGWINGGGTTSDTYCCRTIDENSFRFQMSASNMQYTTGVTYTVIIMAASAFSAS